jgi:hypothetical protein
MSTPPGRSSKFGEGIKIKRRVLFFEPYLRPDSDVAEEPLRHRDAKKEAKKTLIPVGVGPAGATKARSGAKVFLVLFFQKKNFFLS